MAKSNKEKVRQAIISILQSAWTDSFSVPPEYVLTCGKSYCYVSNHAIKIELIVNPKKWGVTITDSLGSTISQVMRELSVIGAVEGTPWGRRGYYRWKNHYCKECSRATVYCRHKESLEVWRNECSQYINPLKHPEGKPSKHNIELSTRVCNCLTKDKTELKKEKKKVVYTYDENQIQAELISLESLGNVLVERIDNNKRKSKKKKK